MWAATVSIHLVEGVIGKPANRTQRHIWSVASAAAVLPSAHHVAIVGERSMRRLHALQVDRPVETLAARRGVVIENHRLTVGRAHGRAPSCSQTSSKGTSEKSFSGQTAMHSPHNLQ